MTKTRKIATIYLPAEQFADHDDSLSAAAEAVAAKLGLEGWDLSPRWDSDDLREEILIDVPAWSVT